MRLTAGFLSLLLAVSPAFAAFGVVQDGNSFVVDAGSSNALVYKVSRSNCDITSIVYRGTEAQNAAPYSHIGSGLGSATVSAQTIGDVVKITCVTSTLTHYYVTRSGDSTIFMATYITQQPSIGELRYIARLKSNVVPNGSIGGDSSNTSGSSSTVEGSDVFIVNGQTRSKFYSSERFIDDEVHCVYGDPMRVCMVIPDPTGYESSSGGPFFRDINHNNGGDYNALYFYMNSGHVQTEPYRMGLHGPYAMVFSRSGDPSKTLDTSFFGNLGIQGYVPTSERGTVRGTATGIPSGFTGVVHWYNAAAQYWTYVSGTSFTSPPMKTGTYTMVLYKDELKVSQQTVTVSRGSTTTSNIASAEGTRNTVWRIGEFNGQPKGFRNADKQLRMHPSDSRMSSWGPLTYTVGNDISGFPMAQIKAINNPTTVVFNLNDISGSFTLRIGTTLAFSGGRPAITVNSWNSANPAAPVKIDSRGFTRGAYRGNGETYDYAIPASALRTGENKIYINVISGNSGDAHLSPNFIYDAVELFKTGGNAVTSVAPVQTTTTQQQQTSTTTQPPATTSAPSGSVAEWAQCGGNGYTGPTACASGLTCNKVNDWYSQCIR